MFLDLLIFLEMPSFLGSNLLSCWCNLNLGHFALARDALCCRARAITDHIQEDGFQPLSSKPSLLSIR